MAADVAGRRYRFRPRRDRWANVKLLTVLLLPATAAIAVPGGLVLAAASQPASTTASSLLPSVLPTVCVGGVLLCPGGVVTPPSALPVPLPGVCLDGVGCVVAPPPGSPPVTSPPPTAGPGQRPTPGPSVGVRGSPSAVVAVAGPLPAPPGVGLVPRLQPGAADGGGGRDAFASLLSVSLRDGLGGGRYHVWPWLLALQLALWVAIALVLWSRQFARRPPRVNP